MRSHRLSIAAAAVAALALLPLAAPAVAQGIGPQANSVTSPIPAPEAVTLQAKITAINPQTRRITLTGAHGNTVRVTAGHAVDLSRLKVGDTVNAQYYRSVAFFVSAPGAAVPEDAIAQAAAKNVTLPGGDVLRVRRISGVVVGIDLPSHSVDLVNSKGGAVMTINVTDPARIALLPQLKLGDTVTAVVSTRLAVSIEPAAATYMSAQPAEEEEEEEQFEGRGGQ